MGQAGPPRARIRATLNVRHPLPFSLPAGLLVVALPPSTACACALPQLGTPVPVRPTHWKSMPPDSSLIAGDTLDVSPACWPGTAGGCHPFSLLLQVVERIAAMNPRTSPAVSSFGSESSKLRFWCRNGAEMLSLPHDSTQRRLTQSVQAPPF